MACTCLLGGFLYGALLHHRHPRRDADHNARTEDNAASNYLVDEEAQHTLRNVVICNDAAAQRTDGNDVAGRPPDHLPRFFANSKHLVCIAIHRYNRRFFEDNPLSLYIDEHIRRPQINSYVH